MKITEVYFSPTGGTKRAVDILAGALGGAVQEVDLCDGRGSFGETVFTPEDLVLIAAPSYGGRAPFVAVQRLSALKGNGAAAVLVAVYGNRAFEDTLVELEDTAKAAGFRVVAGIAAIAEHSILRQYAAGRPDPQDKAQLMEFGDRIAEKLSAGDLSEPALPGGRPYRGFGGTGMVPKANKNCVHCDLCVSKCPVGAIDPSNPRQVNAEACITCMRCVHICPHSARRISPIKLAIANTMLKKACAGRKKNELFL